VNLRHISFAVDKTLMVVIRARLNVTGVYFIIRIAQIVLIMNFKNEIVR